MVYSKTLVTKGEKVREISKIRINSRSTEKTVKEEKGDERRICDLLGFTEFKDY